MFNIKVLFTSVVLYLFVYATPAFSNNKQVFYFEDRYGGEIQVSASESSSGEINYTFIITDDLDPVDVFYDYVVSTLHTQNYTYVQYGAPCPSCNVAHSVPNNQTNAIPLVREVASGRRNIANKFIEGIATTLGNRSANEVFDRATNQGKEKSPIKFFVNSRNGVPMSVCEITSAGCEDVNEVLVLQAANQRIIFEIEKGKDLAYWERTEKIQSAIYNYSRAKQYSCMITFSGDKNDLKSQITCFPSF